MHEGVLVALDLHPCARSKTDDDAFLTLERAHRTGLIVHAKPWADPVPGESRWDRVFVDVRVENPGAFGDADLLPAATGAEAFQWLGMTPTLRYRLAFLPDADVKVEL